MPVTVSHFEGEEAAALISATRVELSDSASARLELTVPSKLVAPETVTVNYTEAAVPRSDRADDEARRRR